MSSTGLDIPYWPYYCEENIWHLCGHLEPEVAEALAVVISSESRRVAVWHQRAAGHPDEPIVWDYHVILLERRESTWWARDPDSLLPAPISATDYLRASFPPLPPGLSEHRPIFRLIDSAGYRGGLRSDRSHMRKADGGWQSPPPPTPCIGQHPLPGSNLMDMVDMRSDFPGQVCDLSGLDRLLGLPHPPHPPGQRDP